MKTEYKVRITKIETGEKEFTEWVKLFESDHPIMKLKDTNDYQTQYGYRKVVKQVKEETNIFEQTTNELDLHRVLRAINKEI